MLERSAQAQFVIPMAISLAFGVLSFVLFLLLNGAWVKEVGCEQVALSGKVVIRDLGLTNVGLHQMDIMDVGEDLGRFDYVIVHGIYSWVPGEVQQPTANSAASITACRASSVLMSNSTARSV